MNIYIDFTMTCVFVVYVFDRKFDIVMNFRKSKLKILNTFQNNQENSPKKLRKTIFFIFSFLSVDKNV